MISESLKFKIPRELLRPMTLSISILCSDHWRQRNMLLISQSKLVILRDQAHILTFLSLEELDTIQSMRLKNLMKSNSMKIFQNVEPMLEKKDRWLHSHTSLLTGEMLNRTKSKIALLFYTTCTQLRLLSSNSKNLDLCVETT